MHSRCTQLVIGIVLACPATASAQKAIPIRTVVAVAQTTEHFATRPSIRQLPGGRVLAHDPYNRRVLVFDSTLSHFTVSADTSGKAPYAYPISGNSYNQLIPYVADSTLFTDFSAQTFIVVDPNGVFRRAMSNAKSQDLMSVAMPYNGIEGVDAKGRLIYRSILTPGTDFAKPGVIDQVRSRDTIAIVRVDFNSRTVDTLASIFVPFAPTPFIKTDANGRKSSSMRINAFPYGPDDWAVMSDGTLAIIRASDYHLDFVKPDGSKTSAPKMPFDWRRVTDEDKQQRLDSLKHVVDSLSTTTRPYGYRTYGFESRTDTVIPRISYVPFNEMPDYLPPVRSGAMKPDADGNLWILPTTSSASTGGGLLYDVANGKGQLIERVQLPKDRLLVGFGKGGVVYMGRYDAPGKFWTLERTHVVR